MTKQEKPNEGMPSAGVSVQMLREYIESKQPVEAGSKVDTWLKSIESVLAAPVKAEAENDVRIVDCGGPYCTKCVSGNCEHVKSAHRPAEKPVGDDEVQEALYALTVFCDDLESKKTTVTITLSNGEKYEGNRGEEKLRTAIKTLIRAAKSDDRLGKLNEKLFNDRTKLIEENEALKSRGNVEVTVEELIKIAIGGHQEHEETVSRWAALRIVEKYPNGLRIVKEKNNGL